MMHGFRGILIRSLALAVALVACLRAAEPRPARQDELTVRPSTRGVLTHWLVAPAVPVQVNDLAAPPRGVREGQPGPGGGTWTYAVSPEEFVDLKPQSAGVRHGAVWAVAKFRSAAGGSRVLTGFAFGALKVYVDGKAVLIKAPAAGDRSDSARAVVELPRGECEIAIASGIRWNYANLALLVTDEKLRPVPGDEQILPLAEGKPADAGAALARGLHFMADAAFVNEGQTVTLQLGQHGGWPADIEAFRPRFKGPDGKELPGVFPDQTPEALSGKAWRASFKPVAGAPHLDVTVELLSGPADGAKVLGTRTLRLYALAGIKAELTRLSEAEAVARAQIGRPLPHTALALEKLGIWIEKLAQNEERPTDALGGVMGELLATARVSLESETKGLDPFANRTGYLERAYWSSIDESPQPYFAMVPAAAAAELARPREEAKKFPLVVFLHGYVPDYHKHRWWTEMPEFNAVFDRQGAFLCIPFGRSNADFVGPGEVDIFAAVREMQRLYPVDPDRVYLYGYSMGGMGVYTVAGHYPDAWAAGIVIAGRADSPLLMKTRGMDSLHAFKQFIVRADHPIDLCENFINVPLRIYHGDQDQFIHPDEARRMEKRLKEIGCDAKLEVHPGNHWFGFDLMASDEPVKWLLAQTRAKDPKVRKAKNFLPRYNQTGDFRVNHVTGALEPFNVEWTYDKDELVFNRLEGALGELFVQHKSGAKIRLPEQAADFSSGVMLAKETGAAKTSLLVVNRKEWGGQTKADSWHVDWKNPARCGPVKEATYRPFLVVYGTTGDAASKERVKAAALKFASDWYDFAKGRAQVKADQDLTDEDRKTRNLFLFGEEQENAIHAACAATKKLPLAVKDGKARIGERTIDLKDRGLMYIYPSPLPDAAPECSVVICSGLVYGQHLPFNHKLDLIPDFLVFGGEMDNDATSTNKPIVAGFFDGKWKLNAATTWFFE